MSTVGSSQGEHVEGATEKAPAHGDYKAVAERYGGKHRNWNGRAIVTEKPWLRQPQESMQAYAAFMTYLTMPMEERSASATAEAIGKSRSLCKKWMAQWQWRFRAAAYEEHYMLLRLESIEADRDRMFVEQKGIAQMGIAIVEHHFQGLMNQIQQQLENQETPNVMKHESLVRLFTEATKVHRMAVMGRVEAADEIKDREERMMERWSEDTAKLLRDMMDELGLEGDQLDIAKRVMERHLVGEQQG